MWWELVVLGTFVRGNELIDISESILYFSCLSSDIYPHQCSAFGFLQLFFSLSVSRKGFLVAHPWISLGVELSVLIVIGYLDRGLWDGF